MNTEILGVVAQVALMVILAYPLGRYIAKVYKGEKTWSDFMAPIERIIDIECILVRMGNGIAGFARMVTFKSGWQRSPNAGSGF